MASLTPLCADLAAEHAALDAILTPLDEAGWDRPTPAAGWTVRDQISHLANSAEAAQLAVSDPELFRERAATPVAEREREFLARGRAMSGDGVLRWWRSSRESLLAVCTPLEPAARINWYGPSMSARSFVTARLMETWAHGQDIVDALGRTRPATPRLRHVAHLGVLARRWSYITRGLSPPVGDVRIELTGPHGEWWTWGKDDLPDRVRGAALDFCLVVTRRRHPADTDLVIVGRVAAEWITIAQAYAGSPGAGRPPGRFPRVAS